MREGYEDGHNLSGLEGTLVACMEGVQVGELGKLVVRMDGILVVRDEGRARGLQLGSLEGCLVGRALGSPVGVPEGCNDG